MSTIVAGDVMKLRSETNAPMMACKQALADAGGDIPSAKALLRERLGALDTAKPDTGKEGLIAIDCLILPWSVTYGIVEIGTETDFAAMSERVIAAADRIAQAAMTSPDVSLAVEAIRMETGENIVFRRSDSMEFGDAIFGIAYYIHHDRRSAGIVVYAKEGNAVADEAVMRSIAMHLVAVTPEPAAIIADDVPAVLVEAERAYLIKKAEASGKPPAIQEKIINGGLTKFRESRALLDQPFVKDPSKKIKDVLPKGISIAHIVRWEVGQ